MDETFYNKRDVVRNISSMGYAVATGQFEGIGGRNKYGEVLGVNINDPPVDIFSAAKSQPNNQRVTPTQARIHSITSTSDEDSGSLVVAGTIDGGDIVTIIDSDATFITSGVLVGDAYINDTLLNHSVIKSVDSEQQITIAERQDKAASAGDAYRIIRADGAGLSVMHLYGVDGDLEPHEEFVIMNGTAGAVTTQEYIDITTAHGDGSGAGIVTNRANQGDISFTAQIDLTLTNHIPAGIGRTQLCSDIAASGEYVYIEHVKATILGKQSASAVVDFVEQKFSDVGAGSTVAGEIVRATLAVSPQDTHPFIPYLQFKTGSRYFLRIRSVSENNTDITGSMHGYTKRVATK